MAPAIGYAIGEHSRLLLDDPAANAIEITFERVNDPLRVDRYIGDREFNYVSVHAMKLSVGSPEPPDWRYLEALHEIAVENGASAISDHLGFTRDGNQGIELGQIAPVPCTEAAFENVCRNIQLIQDYFAPLPFYVETIASPFRLRGTWSDAEFLARVLERTGCGWLLDVKNVYANGLNHRIDPRAFIEIVLPIPQRVQMHLAGGLSEKPGNFYSSSHSQPIPEAVWDLCQRILEIGAGMIDAVFIERDQDLRDETWWPGEIYRARNLFEQIRVPR